MAWTNVKDECMPRVTRVARILGTSDREVLGTLAFLWRNSQDRLAVHATRAQLIDWMHLEGADAATVGRWIAALERAPFISPVHDDWWRIHGNEVEVARAEERHAIAKKGAKARWDKVKMLEACSEHAGSMLGASPIQGKALQEEESAAPAAPLSLPAIAAHGAVAPAHDLGEPESLSPTDLPAKSDDLDLPRAVPKPKLDGKLVQAAVAAYCEAFTERYAVRPPVGPKEVGVIRRLLARIGSLERFRELVQAYVQMPGDCDWFVKRTHDLVTLETNVNQVVVALSRGDPTTSVGWERFWERIDAEESGGTKALRDAVAATS